MKKLISLLLVLCFVMALAACSEAPEKQETPTTEPSEATTEPATEATTEPETEPATEATTEPAAPTVMSYEEYMAAEVDALVCIEAYVQATQSWWDNKITVYAQDQDGAYFLYEMACSEEDAAKLVPGTKIRVTGDKAEWSGEIEIMNATFEFVEGEPFIAEALDVTELLGTDAIAEKQNQKVLFKGLTVEKIAYKNDEPGDDIYVTLGYNGASYDFCVERYLTDPETEVYKTACELKEGDLVDIEGFLYWYEGINPHITAITVAQ